MEDGDQLKQKYQVGGDRAHAEKRKKNYHEYIQRDKTIAAMKQEQVTVNKEHLKSKSKLLEIKNMGEV